MVPKLVDTAMEGGVRYLDVAPLYALGDAELGLGDALHGTDREGIVVSTKVGRLVGSARTAGDWQYDFSAEGIRRSIEESLARLRLERVDIALVHDPNAAPDVDLTTTFEALEELRSEGRVSAIGVGAFGNEYLRWVIGAYDIDCIIAADGCSLLDRRSSWPLADACADRGVELIAAGVLRRGVLVHARQSRDGPELTFEERMRLTQLQEIARAHGVPLAALALQQPLRNRAVTSVLLGASSAEQVRMQLSAARVTVPEAAWRDVDGVVVGSG